MVSDYPSKASFFSHICIVPLSTDLQVLRGDWIVYIVITQILLIIMMQEFMDRQKNNKYKTKVPDANKKLLLQ